MNCLDSGADADDARGTKDLGNTRGGSDWEVATSLKAPERPGKSSPLTLLVTLNSNPLTLEFATA